MYTREFFESVSKYGEPYVGKIVGVKNEKFLEERYPLEVKDNGHCVTVSGKFSYDNGDVILIKRGRMHSGESNLYIAINGDLYHLFQGENTHFMYDLRSYLNDRKSNLSKRVDVRVLTRLYCSDYPAPL